LFVSAMCLVSPMLPVSLDCSFLIAPSVFSNFEGGSCYIWYFCLFPYQMIFVSLTNNSSGATSGVETVHSTRHLVSAVVFSVVRVVKSRSSVFSNVYSLTCSRNVFHLKQINK
jgi:hypothetical protein